MFDLIPAHWSSLALAYAFMFAVVAVSGLGWTLHARWRRRRRLARDVEANRVYAGYLQQALHYPELARPRPADIADAVERARYPWFVGYLLTTCEQILMVSDAPSWRDTLMRQLAPHRTLLQSEAFMHGPYRNLSPKMRAMVRDVLLQPAVPAPAVRPDRGPSVAGAVVVAFQPATGKTIA